MKTYEPMGNRSILPSKAATEQACFQEITVLGLKIVYTEMAEKYSQDVYSHSITTCVKSIVLSVL